MDKHPTFGIYATVRRTGKKFTPVVFDWDTKEDLWVGEPVVSVGSVSFALHKARTIAKRQAATMRAPKQAALNRITRGKR